MTSYILSENNGPFIAYGSSGCGKTALTAKLTREVTSFFFKFNTDKDFYLLIILDTKNSSRS
jgi:hypothetical protein